MPGSAVILGCSLFCRTVPPCPWDPAAAGSHGPDPGEGEGSAGVNLGCGQAVGPGEKRCFAQGCHPALFLFFIPIRRAAGPAGIMEPSLPAALAPALARGPRTERCGHPRLP